MSVNKPIITRSDAEAGAVPNLDRFMGRLSAAVGKVEKAQAETLHQVALGFHAVVIVGKSLKQGEFCERLGKSSSWGTFVQRASIAAVRFEVEPGTPEWTVATQCYSNPRVVAALKSEDLDAGKRALTVLGAEYAQHGKVAALTSREAQPDDGSKAGPALGSSEPSAPVVEVVETVEPSISDVLTFLDAYAKRAGREEWAALENRLSAIISREVTIRSKVETPAVETA